MNPEGPGFQPQSFEPERPKGGKKYLLIGLALLLVAFAVLFFVLKGRGNDDQKTAKQSVSSNIRELTTTFGKPVNYAGNTVYDACGLLTIDTVKAHVKEYKEILANLGTDKVSSDPLTMEHAYVDRDIPAALPGDDKPRATGNTPGPRAYASLFDSHCVYGQGGATGKNLEFARVSITQRPTALSPDFLAYLASIDSIKQTAGDLDVYPVPPEAGDNFVSILIVKKDRSLAVIFRTGNKDLGIAGADEIAGKLAAAPAGPVEITYPVPYAKLVNPCGLLTASDFQQFTGKPMSALATETAYLTDINALTIAEKLHPLVSGVRECRRLETDRDILKSNIAETAVVLRQFRNAASAKKHVQDLKADEADGFTIKSITTKPSGVDEAYVKVEEHPNALSPLYTYEMRQGTAIISLTVEGDNVRADASVEAYGTRLLPAARLVAENYLNQTK